MHKDIAQTKEVRRCIKCGAAVPKTFKFCCECGAQFAFPAARNAMRRCTICHAPLGRDKPASVQDCGECRRWACIGFIGWVPVLIVLGILVDHHVFPRDSPAISLALVVPAVACVVLLTRALRGRGALSVLTTCAYHIVAALPPLCLLWVTVLNWSWIGKGYIRIIDPVMTIPWGQGGNLGNGYHSAAGKAGDDIGHLVGVMFVILLPFLLVVLAIALYYRNIVNLMRLFGLGRLVSAYEKATYAETSVR